MICIFSMVVVVIVIVLMFVCVQEQIDIFSKEVIEKVVYDYLMENFEVIEDVLIVLF